MTMSNGPTKWSEAVARLASQAKPPLLMFDYDGTLAPFSYNFV